MIAAAWVFYIAPHENVPQGEDRELGWSIGQHVVGDAYVWVALLMLAWIAFARSAQLRGKPASPAVQEAPADERSPATR